MLKNGTQFTPEAAEKLRQMTKALAHSFWHLGRKEKCPCRLDHACPQWEERQKDPTPYYQDQLDFEKWPHNAGDGR